MEEGFTACPCRSEVINKTSLRKDLDKLGVKLDGNRILPMYYIIWYDHPFCYSVVNL